MASKKESEVKKLEAKKSFEGDFADYYTIKIRTKEKQQFNSIHE